MPEELHLLPAMIVWLDPGKMSGWAYITDAFNFHSGQDEFMSLGTQLEISCSVHGPALWLGWEDFLITSRTAAMKGSEFALEVIDMARWLAKKYECTLLDPCPPSGRELAGLQKIKRVGWHTPGKPHANDAAMHLLSYMLRDRMLPPDLLAKALDSGPHLKAVGD